MWNRHITGNLEKGAIDTLQKHGVGQIHTLHVPGSFELVSGALSLRAKNPQVEAIICLGSVIRGETAHFDYVCSAAAQGILRVNQDTGKPVMFCVLTDDTHEQAAARSGGEHGNKGVEAAVGLLNMLALRQTLSPSRS